MGLRLTLLGGFRAELDAIAVPLPRKAQALLAFLALSQIDRNRGRSWRPYSGGRARRSRRGAACGRRCSCSVVCFSSVTSLC
jgi:hypothetical protein